MAKPPHEYDVTRACNAFEAGRHCSRKGGYLSDNPHLYDGFLWSAWRAGFEYEEGPRYIAKKGEQ